MGSVESGMTSNRSRIRTANREIWGEASVERPSTRSSGTLAFALTLVVSWLRVGLQDIGLWSDANMCRKWLSYNSNNQQNKWLPSIVDTNGPSKQTTDITRVWLTLRSALRLRSVWSSDQLDTKYCQSEISCGPRGQRSQYSTFCK